MSNNAETFAEMLAEQYDRYFLRPHSLQLFRDCSVLAMSYAQHGTIVDVVRALITGRTVFSSAEHEYLVQFLAAQMLEALAVLHSADVIHCDVKTGEGDPGRVQAHTTYFLTCSNLQTIGC